MKRLVLSRIKTPHGPARVRVRAAGFVGWRRGVEVTKNPWAVPATGRPGCTTEWMITNSYAALGELSCGKSVFSFKLKLPLVVVNLVWGNNVCIVLRANRRYILRPRMGGGGRKAVFPPKAGAFLAE